MQPLSRITFMDHSFRCFEISVLSEVKKWNGVKCPQPWTVPRRIMLATYDVRKQQNASVKQFPSRSESIIKVYTVTPPAAYPVLLHCAA